MKRNLIKICVFSLFSAAILNGCSSEKNDTNVQPKTSSQQASEVLTEQQKQEIHAKADEIIKESLAKNKAMPKSNQREAYSYEVLGTDIVGKSGCTFSLYSYIRNYSILDATGKATFNSTFCAQPGHLRYGVFYYISSTGAYSTVGGVTGSPGSCLSGGVTYPVNVSSPTDGFSQIVVFDVITTGPSGGPVFVNNLYSNPRHLDCFGASY